MRAPLLWSLETKSKSLQNQEHHDNLISSSLVYTNSFKVTFICYLIIKYLILLPDTVTNASCHKLSLAETTSVEEKIIVKITLYNRREYKRFVNILLYTVDPGGQ